MDGPQVFAIEFTVRTILLEDKNIHTQSEDGVQLISAKCRPLLVVPIHPFHRSPKIGHEKRGPKPPFLSIQLFAQKRAPNPIPMDKLSEEPSGSPKLY